MMANKLNTSHTDGLLLGQLAELKTQGEISLGEYNTATETLLYPINKTAMDADTFSRLRRGKAENNKNKGAFDKYWEDWWDRQHKMDGE